MANKKHLDMLKKGVNAWNRWRKDNPEITRPDLVQAELGGESLQGVDFRAVSIHNAKLSGADFSGADLIAADLAYADLSRTNLSQTLLQLTKLEGANLLDANLYAANLFGADLRRANLNGANLTDSVIGECRFEDNDLSGVKGLEMVRHDFSSSISIGTIYRSKGKIPEVFLRGVGVPEDFITYMRSLVGTAFEFYSCFISHSSRDQHFATQLHANLQDKGVRCWYFLEDARWGESVWGEIDHSIKVYDKLVVICSADALQSGPVNREIERALQREDLEHRHILFPIRIDEYLFETWKHPRRADVLSKVVGDFRNWSDPASYKRAFDRLLQNLKAEDKAQSAAQR
jgi:hypothetical protein